MKDIFFFIKQTKILFSILLLLVVLFFSCHNRRTKTNEYPQTNDYSLFPQGTILAGTMEDGRTFYLIRENLAEMAGVCLIDNNQAVAEIISFCADLFGATDFVCGNAVYSGKISVNPTTKEIEITLPNMPIQEIEAQSVTLRYLGTVPERVDCQERYKNPVFENMIAKKNIQYDTARGYYVSKPSDYISKEDYEKWFSEMLVLSWKHKGFLFKGNMKQLPLTLDIYQPENDNIARRPLLLLIHGGAFFFGDKENRIQQVITDDAVKKGFVVASINYRLGTAITPDAIKRIIYRDVQDTRAALRYLVHHKEKFGIDEEQIYLAGSSAGGIISLTTAFMDNNEVYSSIGSGWLSQREDLGGLDRGDNLNDSFKIAGVASLWGGVTHLDMLDNNRIPTLLFHGTADNIVPCNEGLPFRDIMGELIHRGLSLLFGKIYGSAAINTHLQSLNFPVNYIAFPGAGHDPCLDPDGTVNEKMTVIRHELGNFLYDNVSKHYFPHCLSGKTVVGKYDAVPVYQLDNSENITVQWHVDGGLITNQTKNAIRVIWYSTSQTGTITACLTNKNGISCKKELKVEIN